MFQSCVVLGYRAHEVLFWAGFEADDWKGEGQLDWKTFVEIVLLNTGPKSYALIAP